MSNPWFRLYAEAVDDEKLRLLAFEDRWHYVAILCCKCKGILDEANKELVRRKVAVKLGINLQTLDEVARRLAEVELIDANTLQPTGWDKRQFSSDFDPTRNERKQRFLQKKKQGTDEERGRNGQGTDEERPPEAEADTDTDTETEADVGQRRCSARASASIPPVAPVATPVPTPPDPVTQAPKASKATIRPDWTPSESTYALLEKHGIGRSFAEGCVDEFRLYWQECGKALAGFETAFFNNVKRQYARPPVPASARPPPTIPTTAKGAEWDSILKNVTGTRPVIEGECYASH